MHHVRIRERVEDRVGEALHELELVTPPAPPQTLGVLPVNAAEQTSVGRRTGEELRADARHVGLERQQGDVPGHRREAALQVAGPSQISEAGEVPVPEASAACERQLGMGAEHQTQLGLAGVR
jgi:hypothetical protein